MRGERFYELHKGQPHAFVIRSEGDHWKGAAEATRITAAEGKRRLAEESRKKLLEILKPGDTVRCVLRHVQNGEERYLSGYMLNLGIGERARGGKDGVGMGGCGMDMGFAAVYDLGYLLWPKGTDKPHGTRNGEPDSDGGYALKHRWI